ncbi:MAG: cysteine--1-D-myo-inosityl 2-amino-2-deoxy-alpha-D-glucopyranoside ligase [Actinobacteria bacterium]|nr:cysteine--1-D-myo-inosityl 2-amino-2-deoxy-alpha-D-glucopyranoside ligase [Actinomycetota bacterium]
MKSWHEVEVPTSDSSFDFPVLQLTNSAWGSKELLVSKPLYRMYVCGITPYDATHLGHAATYLTFDLINRYLRASGSEVRYVQNITDIDDPLLERAKRDGVDWTDLAHQQIDLFRSDMVKLRVIPPADYIGAVDAIPLVTAAIQELSRKNSIYSVDEDLYFDVHSDKQFGKRSHLSSDEMLRIFSERGGDPNRVGKAHPLDCLVWMSQRPNEPGWPSPFGMGRPGWHIECTAIAIKYLDPDSNDSALIDIQGGGSDLIFPHHEMCAAQAEVMSGKPLAATYVHAGMIGLDGEKMSKSKGNLVFVSKLLEAGRDPMAIRWALMKSHYRTDRMWTDELLVEAEVEINVLRSVLSGSLVAPTASLIQTIIDSLANDLDTPAVVQAVLTWSSQLQSGGEQTDAKSLLTALDTLLGIKL